MLAPLTAAASRLLHVKAPCCRRLPSVSRSTSTLHQFSAFTTAYRPRLLHMASTDGEDDADLKAAIAMSLDTENNGKPTTMSGSGPSNPVGGILGLDRKAMEQGRLARAASRKHPRDRSISPPSRATRKAPKLEETSTTLPSGAKLKMFSSGVRQAQESHKPAVANAVINRMKEPLIKSEPDEKSGVKAESLPAGAIKYPNGVVKRTWAYGHERTGNEVKIEEVLEASSLRTAVLSAFQWDTEWLLPKLRTPLHGGSTKCIFVMHAKGDKERNRLLEWAEEGSSFLRVCLPPMHGLVWCMHSKLMLLFHSQKLRIAIPTANLLNFDWGETGQMENSVFMIDLPRLPNSTQNSMGDLTPFGKELMHFIENQRLDNDVRNSVLNFDFSATKDMAFVHTVGGVHYRQQAERTGLLGLSRAVRDFNLTADENQLELDFAASSIGQLNEKYLQDFYLSASGQDLIARAAQTKAQTSANFFKKKGPARKDKQADSPNIKEKLRVYFPTKETVQASTAGAAGTICLQRSYFESTNFPRAIFRDYKSTRKGLLSHNKILCARSVKGSAWLYVGSANMSKSAWGELPAARNEKKITCRNWECGVLLPIVRNESAQVKKESDGDGEVADEETDEETDDEDEPEHEQSRLVSMDVFKDTIALPFECPGEAYDGREPWYFKEQQS